VRLGLFSPSLPHLVAIREGYYEERGVTVEQGLLWALRNGDLDVALTSPDNVANFRLNKAGDGRLDPRIIAAAADAQTGVVPDAVITPAQLEVVLELRKR
jgi:ABC-type nitrate/sulfonate/bicarbonate transport system substrate-binding protein